MALCDVYEPAVIRAARSHPRARRLGDFRKLYDHAGEFDAVVVSTTEHTHAFATLPASATRQARLLREAADAQHLGGPRHPRGGRQGQGRDPDGHPDPCRRQLPPRRGADPDRRHRAGARGARLGRPRLGPAVRRGGQDATATSSRCASGPAEPIAGPERASTGTSGLAPRRRGRSTRSTSPGRSGIAGGTSATAP